MRGPVRIGNFSGYLGDRFTAIDEVMAGDPVDVLMGDYLAEVTLAALSGRDGRRGYVSYFLDQIRPHLAAIAERGMKVVTNAGGFDPAGLADALLKAAAEEGADVRVAYVEGDDVLSRLPEYERAGHLMENLDSGEPLSAWGLEPLAANAYLGGWGIARALAEGADIVVCGRVTDASLTAGPAAWWHDWALTTGMRWPEPSPRVMSSNAVRTPPVGISLDSPRSRTCWCQVSRSPRSPRTAAV